ncbi:MAG: 50S ribosomal protein L18 [Candidatus Buchananbacteria bacterium]
MAKKEVNKAIKKARRKGRVRAKVFGTASRPRLNVFRSLKFDYAQLIDDQNGKTLASAKSTEIKTKGTKTELAQKVGELIATKAQKAGINEVVFDKSAYKYHGRIQAIAEGARKGGLKF